MDKVKKIDREQCVISLICAAIVVVCVCIGVVMNLTTLEDENFDHMGLRTFCMFTVNSNIIVGVGMFLTIPYAIDELRRKSYRVPDWLVTLLFILVTSVSVTFLVSLFILAPVKGFMLIFTGSRFFLHAVCPILSILTFCFFIKDHRLSFRSAFLTLIPVFAYACLYYVMVRVIGEENGGWNDFYGFLTRIPPWIAIVAILPITFGIALALRALHNASCDRFNRRLSAAMHELYGTDDLDALVSRMARSSGKIHPTGTIRIPRDMIQSLGGLSEDDPRLDSLCSLYLEEFLNESALVLKNRARWSAKTENSGPEANKEEIA